MAVVLNTYTSTWHCATKIYIYIGGGWATWEACSDILDIWEPPQHLLSRHRETKKENLYRGGRSQDTQIYGSQVDILCGGREKVVSGAVQENFEYGMHWSSAFQPFFFLCTTITNKTIMCLFICQFTYYLSICTYQSVSPFQFSSCLFFIVPS